MQDSDTAPVLLCDAPPAPPPSIPDDVTAEADSILAVGVRCVRLVPDRFGRREWRGRLGTHPAIVDVAVWFDGGAWSIFLHAAGEIVSSSCLRTSFAAAHEEAARKLNAVRLALGLIPAAVRS